MRLARLYRYPVKGLSPEPLKTADLPTGGYFPCDRLFALENGPSGFASAAPEHQPKIKFLMLMKNAALAGLATRYDEAAGVLTISKEGRDVAKGDLRTAEGRSAIERYLSDFVGAPEVRGPVKLLEAPDGFRFTDSKSGFVSLINLASCAEIEKAQGARVDPLRFRGNLYVDGAPAWAEADWPGKSLRIGGVALDVLKMTDRCAATGVEPGSGKRDMDVVQTLRMNFGHIDCGVYARIEKGGRIAVGDAIELI
ncbi:MOSC domain-containing protein [Methylocystis parvus]|uniref:MOSC domain-containing protein n=1 Tax=Methylocystis parvus TaxID=134 RepID=A0A6B8M1R2_9HYPH|nr:MOSC N-terminal beta barrel domain-containing protein [Methylocystis parvus]QGM96222.1 MOSC domain-containing protein [Methylocystis parvus]WBJ99947.1 MOSC domain-containing protein [Methylocystis parvus OBBP]